MTIKIHNTLTGKLDEFKSIQPEKVSLYTCGPTVYDYPHIGNWAAYIYWDVLVRILTINGYDVKRVMNITDVGHLVSDADEGEDKLEKGARREGKTAWKVAKFYTDVFLDGMKKLNLIEPSVITKATEYIPQQLDLVRQLKTKGVTYQIDDGIYFDTSKFASYADFAHLNLEELKAGARVEYNQQKRNPSDFALWKFTPEGEKRDMEWPTPTDLTSDGKERMGFPGWHIECSAMALSELGKTIDIHTGGIDHIPVHHTNEIAQSETANGVRFSNYWMHNNFLKVDGRKFSKSLGNGYTLDDLKKQGFTPLDFRMFLLQTHYRSEGNFTFDNLQSAHNRLHNWRNIAILRHQIHDTVTSDKERNDDEKTLSLYATSQAIIEAINNDLNTPEALSIIDEAFTKLQNTRLENINANALNQLLDTIDQTLGLELINNTPDISDESKQLIIKRNLARQNKDWNLSDKLRDELLDIGITLLDNQIGTIWQYTDK
ncbi:cysteine--tRNA ligase [Candidatus Saccharibacteria bacterium]|nr:cysteine--tRNA ligase [Candidatus Saccharibacteria bacterium]